MWYWPTLRIIVSRAKAEDRECGNKRAKSVKIKRQECED